MKHWLPIVLFANISCSNTPANHAPKASDQFIQTALTPSDSTAVVSIVQDFFAAFDKRDLQKMNNILGPAITIIHHNGTTTNRKEMLAVIKETKNWWPRTRHLSGFEVMGNDGLAIVGLNNEVIFSLPGNKKVEEHYKETWIFKKTGTQWLPVRCHYSKIIAEKHTEEVM